MGDSNVAAQQEGIASLCVFLKMGSKDGCTRTRSLTIPVIVEKGLASTRPAIKASSLEALLLYIELDVPGPVIEDILPGLSNKQPKVVAATLAALTSIYHNYGCKTVDPKPVLKTLSKAFGHADKNVRAEATNLTVEFYRWLRDAMKPMLWGDLKPTQQADLEAQFEKVKSEPPPKQERFLRSQQAAMARAPPPGAESEMDDGGDDAEEPVEVDAFDLAEPQEVLSKISTGFYDNLASPKWKDRKDALDGLYALLNVPRLKDGDFSEVNRSLAKCMKDANIAVVTQAAQCIEVLAKGLRKSYGKYRSIVMLPIMERLKEKKQTVADALGAALDQVFLATSLSECLEDTISCLSNKNPQVKEGTMKFLIRCLRTTREVPSKQEIATIVESAKKLLSESSEVLRSGGAEVLGTVMKIVGERSMNQHLDGLDDIRKTKIKEFFETAEVKAKERPKPIIAAPGRGPVIGNGPPRKVLGGGSAAPGPKKVTGLKKAAPAAAPPPPREPSPPPAPVARVAPAGSKLGMPKPGGAAAGLKAPQKRTLPGPPAIASPRRPAAAPMVVDDEPPPQPAAQPRLGGPRAGALAGRSLAKPAAQAAPLSVSPPPTSHGGGGGMTALERAEMEELRASNERLLRQVEELRTERSRLLSEVQELKNQNASLIEDHTRDVLSIKAKETQLVRARSDAEAAEQVNERLRRELERLKRALNRAEGLGVGAAGGGGSVGSPSSVGASPTHDDVGIYRDGGVGAAGGFARNNRISYASNLSEEKENGEGIGGARNYAGTTLGGPTDSAAGGPDRYRGKLTSPELRYYQQSGGALSGRGSPVARGFRNAVDEGQHQGYGSSAGGAGAAQNAPAAGAESWKRAAEVTSQLKARIEQMKVSLSYHATCLLNDGWIANKFDR